MEQGCYSWERLPDSGREPTLVLDSETALFSSGIHPILDRTSNTTGSMRTHFRYSKAASSAGDLFSMSLISNPMTQGK